MIVSAAIKFKVSTTGREVVLCGPRHGDIFSQLHDLGRAGECSEVCQGFITNYGEFLNRQEAFWHANQCGQLSWTTKMHKQEHFETELYSEDLY